MEPDEAKIEECPITNKQICIVIGNTVVKALAPFGECAECGTWVHESALSTASGMDRAPYPIEYIGYICQECREDDSKPRN